MLTCNSNRLPICTTTRAFFQVDMVPCVFLIWSHYLDNANLICGMRDCTQIVNQTIDLCECFSKGLRMTCCISQCSLGVYFTDSDTGIYSKGVRDMRAFCVIETASTYSIPVFSQSYFTDIRAVYNYRYAQNYNSQRLCNEELLPSWLPVEYVCGTSNMTARWRIASVGNCILSDLYHPYTRLCIHSYQIRVDKYLSAS